MSTVTALDWVKAKVEAPDASYQMAQVHFNPASQTLTVRNRTGATVGTYTLTGHNHSGDVLTGTTENGDIEVQPDPRCPCIGFKKKPR